MVVPGSQVERGERAAFEAKGFLPTSQESGHGVGATLYLQSGAVGDLPRRAPRTVAGRDEGVGGRIDGARTVPECARKELLEARKGIERISDLLEVETDGATEDPNLRAQQGPGEAQRGEAPHGAGNGILRERAERHDRELSAQPLGHDDGQYTAHVRSWLRLSNGIDRLNLTLGRLVAWLALLMIAIGAYNAVGRYLGRFIGLNLSSNAYLELQQYLFSALFLLSAAAVLARDEHVRVDVLYSRLSSRAKVWIDLTGTLLFLIPFCVLAIYMSWPAVQSSWAILEASPDPGGLPRYPLKSLIPISFALLIVQGVSQVIKQIASLRGREGQGERG